MTEQDKATIIGNAVLEEKRNNETLAALDSQFRVMANDFHELSYALYNDKHGIVFEADAVIIPTSQRDSRRIPIRYFNLETFQRLLEQHRKCLETKRQLDNELVRLGVRNKSEEVSIEDIGKFRQHA